MARGEGEVIHRGRNELRIMHYDGLDLVVKAFHRPHVINRFVYGTLRASKAKRSYANACLLLRLGIGTPQPVGYYNVRSTLGLAFDKSYFVTLRSVCTHRYEEFFEHDMPEMPDVLRAIGHLTARLHEAGLAHKDYGRANILFGYDKDGQLRIELVDLNRIAQDDAEQLPLIRVSHRVLGGEFAQRPDDKCQWSAQLVAGIVEELRLFVAELTHPAVGPTRHRNGAPHEQ